MPNGIVPAPRVENARYGLLSVAEVVNHGARDEHWASGVSWHTEVCGYDVSVIDICDPSNDTQVVESSFPGAGNAPGFAIDVTDVCTTTFALDADARRSRLQRAVKTVTDKAVERALWTGLDGTATYQQGEDTEFPSFINAGAEVLGGGAAVPVLEALSLLEDAFARDLGIRGTIHASRRAGVYIAEKLRIEDADNITTKLGSKVVFGTGYETTGPGGVAAEAGSAWVFGTGPVVVHLGPVVIYETPEISRNDIINKAERPAAVVWDRCGLYAVRVSLNA